MTTKYHHNDYVPYYCLQAALRGVLACLPNAAATTAAAALESVVHLSRRCANPSSKP